MFKFSTKVQTAGEVLGDGFKLYQFSLKSVLLWALIISFCSQLPLLHEAITGERITSISMHLSITQIFYLIVLSFISSYFISVIFHRMYTRVTTPEIGVKQSLQLALNKLPLVFATMIIAGIMILIGFVIFIIPGIVLGIFVIFYLPNIVLDNGRIFDSIKTSFRLVWGSWWQTLFVVLVPGVILVVLNAILTFSIGGKNPVMLIIINVLLFTVITPLIDAMILVQFNNLKLKKIAA